MTHGTDSQRTRAAAVEAARVRPRRLHLGALVLALWLIAFAAPAFAGPPRHLHNPALDISGFNHACGTAVDSKGDVYVSSAGESKIKVFNPAHTELASIPNANEPCGLAVDTNGNLYVSEKGTHNVVKYVPNAYPFSGALTYGSAVAIDESGDAEGISVDPTDDLLYVAEGNRVALYSPNGDPGVDEGQRVLCLNATGGTYKLSFEGEQTAAIPCEGSDLEVEEALEGLSTIGAGNVSVAEGPNHSPKDHLVTFTGALAGTDVELLVGDSSELVGPPQKTVFIEERSKGFDGHIGEGELSEATGVAAYAYRIEEQFGGVKVTRYLDVADADGDVVKVFSGNDVRALKYRRTVEGPAAGEGFAFGPAGSYLAVDPGNGSGQGCASVAEQACTAGHFLVYDAAREAVEEFDASGEFIDQIADVALEDAEPTGFAVDRSGAAGDGTIYITSGAGSGSKVMAFGPLVTPSRSSLPELSRALTAAQGVATDSHGNIYVAAGAIIHVYSPSGSELTQIQDGRGAHDLAVDSKCNLYVLDGPSGQQAVTYYAPAGGACPPTGGTTYQRHSPVLAQGFVSPEGFRFLEGVDINPKNDHAFVLEGGALAQAPIVEFDSAAQGSSLEGECGTGLSALGFTGGRLDIAVNGATGRVYVSMSINEIYGIDCGEPSTTGDDEVVTLFRGSGCLSGKAGSSPQIAVDQSNGHVLAFEPGNGAREYDASGSCVAEFGTFSAASGSTQYDIAIDNSGGPTDGDAYVAFDGNNNAVQPFDLTAFGPLSYGEAPSAATGVADGIGAETATLKGTVNPNGFGLEECRFEYLTDDEYKTNGKTFAGAVSVGCAETTGAIGHGGEAIPVHVDLSGLNPSPQAARYRFRLIAKSKYGEGDGEAGVFGPPQLTTKTALPILYDEATLRAEIDPSGLATKYHFDYGTAEGVYDQSTPVVELPPGDGPVSVKAALTGLEEGTEYHFQLVAENEAATVKGPEAPDQSFETLTRRVQGGCPNSEYRTGLSAKLPECRAYELTTPADTNGAQVGAVEPSGNSDRPFSNWLVNPRGEGAGESVGFFSGTLPGLDGTGETDGYRSQRGAGEHPAGGWKTEFYGPDYAQLGGAPGNQQEGVGPDQRYWLWSASPVETFESTLAKGNYLRTPKGAANPACNDEDTANPQSEFELIGCASLGVDPGARGRFLSPGATHVIFASSAHLDDAAPPPGTTAIYDRPAGSADAEVVSVEPSGDAFAANATYVAATEDGSAVVFQVGSGLYLHRGGQTTEIAQGPSLFAGISADGNRVFYTATTFPVSGTFIPPPAGLFVCDVEAGPCVGGSNPGLSEIAPDSVFVNVSAHGSAAFFTSEEALTGSEQNENGEEATATEHNLYVWDGSSTRFIAILDDDDVAFGAFDGVFREQLLSWTASVGGPIGRANSPTRSTSDGEELVFQSHAQLTAYDSDGIAQVYRYAPAATSGERLTCVSCDPSKAPATGEALLQTISPAGFTDPTTMIANLTDDGQTVFFESPDRLLPDDANGVNDVYEWQAKGAGEGSEECKRSGGCLALISSGQGEKPSFLYGMSADGHDVFFNTTEKLVGQDVPSSDSIYDARVQGGIPDPPLAAPCQGDACQGQGSVPPVLPQPSSTAPVPDGNVEEPSASKCPKGKRKVKSKGKARCVANKKPHKHKSQKGKHHKANANRGASR